MSKIFIQPLYLQVRDALAMRIASGEWKADAAIPNETDLARELGVSPGTTRKALDLLEDDGVITRRQGRGTFVNDPSSPKLTTRYNNICGPGGERVLGEISILEIAEGPANEVEHARLHLGERDRVCRLRRVRSHMSASFLVEDVSLPASLFPRLSEKTDLCSRGIVTTARAFGVLLGDAVERISLGGASPAASAALNVAHGSPILLLDRIVRTRSGQPAEWRLAECTTSKTHYEVETH